MKRYGKETLLPLTPARYDSSKIFLDAAKVAGNLLVIHPFREGNGRVAKLLASILILQAGFNLPDMTKISKDDLINSALDAYGENYNTMSDLLEYASTSER